MLCFALLTLFSSFKHMLTCLLAVFQNPVVGFGRTLVKMRAGILLHLSGGVDRENFRKMSKHVFLRFS